MKIISTGAADILLVDIPQGATDFRVVKDRLFILVDKSSENWDERKINLPEGYNYTILGRAKELTEEAWQILIRNYGGKMFDYDPKHYNSYPDYELENHPFESKFFDTATESGHSLLKAQGILIENLIPEPQILDYTEEEWMNGGSEVYYDRLKTYRTAEARVKNPLVIKAEKI